MALEILKRALKDKYVSAILAAALIFLYIFWLATFYPSLKPMLSGYDELLKNPTMKAFLGDSVVSMTTFSGFMTLEVFSYMGLVIGAFVIFMAASFAAGEIEQKSIEMLLSLPVSRVHIIVSRFVALLPITALIVLAELLAIYLGGVYIGEDIQIIWFAYAMLFVAAFVIAIGALALFVSSLMSDGRKAALVSLGVLLAMFLVENIGSMVTSIDWARNLSLFHYTKTAAMVNQHVVDWGNLGILIGVALVFLAGAIVAFWWRDINVT